ncbi:MAG: S-adenosyl-l-methionine hydroxide adenosyltransferase family protein [Archaeoglobi archaeon]|nr:S-adenosyl-l-methionine hydroxide adenosyltransferase family protein [Candidatus Mnemosynella bozhongmuii]
MSLITLLTDFGDFYPGVMKGVILRINPDARIIDLSHSVSPQNVKEGAFLLLSAVPYFPEGTIHVAVVDPTVGTERKAILIEAGGQILIGPDNGLLIPAARRLGDFRVYEIFIEPESKTFHGRDVFAVAAGMISAGKEIEMRGLRDFVNLDFLRREEEGKIICEVLHVDRFGNVITSLQELQSDELILKGVRLRKGETYADVPEGEPLILRGSSGFFEIAVRNGNASKMFSLKPGDILELEKVL